MAANQYLGGAGRFRNRNPGKYIIQAFVSRASVKVARAAVLWLGLAPAPIFGSAAQAADTSRRIAAPESTRNRACIRLDRILCRQPFRLCHRLISLVGHRAGHDNSSARRLARFLQRI